MQPNDASNYHSYQHDHVVDVMVPAVAFGVVAVHVVVAYYLDYDM
jgi:hypothetical protein